MNLDLTPEESQFRDEIRAFLQNQLPADTRHKVINGLMLVREDYTQWQQALYRQGWGAPSWPREFGGTGWDVTRQTIFEDACAAAGSPRLPPFGTRMVGPVIIAFGNRAQQDRFLPKILSAEHWWCQGYSEPEAGSDLASLKMRARREGEHYVVDGQKTWTTLAQYADWIFCLVRTDSSGKPQQGISFLLIDMQTPGVTVRPIITLDGRHEINEVWFDNVKVPVENLVGDENKGWTYAKFLLGHERTNIAGIGIAKRELQRLKQIAATEQLRGKALLEDPLFAAEVARIEIELAALEITNLRVLAAEQTRRAPGAGASLLKIKGTEIQQAISELMVQAVGPYALPWFADAAITDLSGDAGATLPAHAAPLAAQYCNLRKLSIFGGSNEIQKNIVAQSILGL